MEGLCSCEREKKAFWVMFWYALFVMKFWKKKGFRFVSKEKERFDIWKEITSNVAKNINKEIKNRVKNKSNNKNNQQITTAANIPHCEQNNINRGATTTYVLVVSDQLNRQ